MRGSQKPSGSLIIHVKRKKLPVIAIIAANSPALEPARDWLGNRRRNAPQTPQTRARQKALSAKKHTVPGPYRGGRQSETGVGGSWRIDRDSNPRDGSPPTHFPGVRLRPLGHRSVCGVYPAIGKRRKGGKHAKCRLFSQMLYAINCRLTLRFCRPFFSILPISTRPISAVRATWVPPQG
jgi:hypothetical protein